ncbi:MAG: YihY/virulence factor BrkB family protein [Bryobacteraceae bacterium]
MGPKIAAGWGLARASVAAWVEYYAPSIGAALSYYTVFSLAPTLLIVISVGGLMFGNEAVHGAIFWQLQTVMGPGAAAVIEGLLASVAEPAEGISGTLIGGVLLWIGATSVFGEVQDALDGIWRAPARDRSGGLIALVRNRIVSFGMILGIAFLLTVNLVNSAAISALGKWWQGAFSGWGITAQVVNGVAGFAVTTGAFALIYKGMPRVKSRWQDVWLGAAVTAALFTVGHVLIGLYIGKSALASGFGAAGSLVIVLGWVYCSAQIFLLGAEFTWVYARTYGSMRAAPDCPDRVPGPVGDV